MRFFHPVLCTLLCLPLSAVAVLSTDAQKAVSFYRSPESLFPSGQASRSTLEEKILRSDLEVAFKTRWDQKDFTLQGEQILRDIQVSRFAKTKTFAQLLKENDRGAQPVKNLSGDTQVEILKTDAYWALVIPVGLKIQGWMPLHQLQTIHNDSGVYVNLIDTFLRQEPRLPSAVITTVPRLRRVIPLAFNKGFMKVKYEDHTGYVDINHFVSRADFATLAYHGKKGWAAIRYRNNDSLVTAKGNIFPLGDVKGYVTNADRGIMIQAEGSYGPQLRSRVEITHKEACIWAQSQVSGHGQVWWKYKDLLVEDSPQKNSLTTEELMKREIYSIAFESKTSVRGLVSAEGIYKTEDGINWVQLSQFGKQNYPVTIHPSGAWLVGSFKSENKGQSFEPFIRWDQITEAITSAHHRAPRIMRLTQVDSLPRSQVQIHIDTGTQRLKLKGSLAGADWKLVKPDVRN